MPDEVDTVRGSRRSRTRQRPEWRIGLSAALLLCLRRSLAFSPSGCQVPWTGERSSSALGAASKFRCPPPPPVATSGSSTSTSGSSSSSEALSAVPSFASGVFLKSWGDGSSKGGKRSRKSSSSALRVSTPSFASGVFPKPWADGSSKGGEQIPLRVETSVVPSKFQCPPPPPVTIPSATASATTPRKVRSSIKAEMTKGELKEAEVITSVEQYNALVRRHADNHERGVGNTIMVTTFTASWCRSCKLLKGPLKRLRQAYPTGVSFYEVDVSDRFATRAMKRALGVNGVPVCQVYLGLLGRVENLRLNGSNPSTKLLEEKLHRWATISSTEEAELMTKAMAPKKRGIIEKYMTVVGSQSGYTTEQKRTMLATTAAALPILLKQGSGIMEKLFEAGAGPF